jgi:hypothetical protein
MQKHNPTHKVVTFLERKEVEFLDKLKNDALFSTGHKLTYNDILKGLVELAMDTHLDGQDVHSDKELEEKMLKKIKETLEKIKNSGGQNEK